jgi:hypothetical protein
MRSLVAVMVAASFTVATAQAGETRYKWVLQPIQAVEDGGEVAAPPPLSAPRPPVAEAPAVPPSPVAPFAATPAPAAPPVVGTAPEEAEPPTVPAPRPPSVATPAETTVFSMTGEHVAAIGVGVIGGLVILDGVLGVPAAAAAFVGGLAGQWWHTTYQVPSSEYRVNRRVPLHVVQEAAARDGAANGRLLKVVTPDGRVD